MWHHSYVIIPTVLAVLLFRISNTSFDPAHCIGLIEKLWFAFWWTSLALPRLTTYLVCCVTPLVRWCSPSFPFFIKVTYAFETLHSDLTRHSWLELPNCERISGSMEDVWGHPVPQIEKEEEEEEDAPTLGFSGDPRIYNAILTFLKKH